MFKDVLTRDEIAALIKREVEKSGQTAYGWARDHNLSVTQVYSVLKATVPPSAQMLELLGYKRVLGYAKKDQRGNT